MSKYTKRARPRNSLYQLDMFEWRRDRDFLAENPAACRLAARLRISVHRAALLMQLHGLGAR